MKINPVIFVDDTNLFCSGIIVDYLFLILTISLTTYVPDLKQIHQKQNILYFTQPQKNKINK